MDKYRVLSQLHHNNRLYQVGEEVELDSVQAAHLLGDEVIEPLPAPAKTRKPKSEE